MRITLMLLALTLAGCGTYVAEGPSGTFYRLEEPYSPEAQPIGVTLVRMMLGIYPPGYKRGYTPNGGLK